MHTYFETVYLMTSTISTVGFGDLKGFNSTEPIWAPEMVYLFFVTLLGIILFSTVTNEIFNYRELKTLKAIISERMSETEQYLWCISRVIKTKSMKPELIDECLFSIKQFYVSSTKYYFENEFYENLPPRL